MRINLKVLAVVMLLTIFFREGKAQDAYMRQLTQFVFDRDSLQGFDEEAASRAAISEHFTGAEFPLRMYMLKRQYINNKYNLQVNTFSNPDNNLASRAAVVPGCVNEDFEASVAGAVTVSNQVSGWTVTRGSNNPYLPGQTGYSSCNLNGCCPVNPSESAVFSVPNGLIDPIIGSCYPIYSVFGTNPGNPNGNVANPQISMGMRGDNFIRINSSQTGDYSIEKLSKTIAVTAQNALFQFAFISVFSPGHGCCDAGAFQIKLPGIPCPTFSASALSSQCTNTATGISFLAAQTCAPAGLNNQYIFNKWQISSIDLTQYIGQNITIEIVATDCTAGGHFGYVYFDAQCGPMTIIGNNNPFPAGSPSVTLPTCGAQGATICATPGLGPYSWAGQNVPANYTIPSYTNQCFTSSLSATYTLYMNPPGACAPIQRVITTTITPAPLLNASIVQATCGNTIAVVSVTPSGSAGSPSSITWWPPPLSLNSQTTVGQYTIPAGPAPTIVSVTASDPLGCLITATVPVLPAAPFPTFTVVNNSNTYSITCLTPSINLDIASTYTYGSLEYFWSANSFTSASSNVTLTAGQIYTVSVKDPVSLCAQTKTISIGINTLAPVSALSPSFQNITCNNPNPQTVTLTATSPTLNFSHFVISPVGGSVTSGSASMIYQPGPGTFTHCLVNNVNGCSTCKEFTVASGTGFPTFSLTSERNFTLGCNSRSFAVVNIANGATSPVPGGAVSYTLIPPNGSSVTPAGPLSSTSTYTIITPGTWTAITKDNATFCETRIPFSIIQNTIAPSIDSVAIPNNILTCDVPKTRLRGISFTPNVNYNWSFPGVPGNQAGDSLTVFADLASPSKTLVANYTLTIEDNSSTCKSFTVFPILQNLYKPKALISNGGTASLTCLTPSIVLTNASSTGILPNSIFPSNLPVVGFEWFGPTPQLPEQNVSTYLALVPGEYTLVAKDLNNGCTSPTVIIVGDNQQYPILNNPVAPPTASLDCGSDGVFLDPIITTPTTNLSYQWLAPPGAVTSDKSKRILLARQIGEYKIIVTNTVNGCVSAADMGVVNGSLTASFNADRETGFAPMTVNFVNTSRSSLDTNKIISVWSFGNGTTRTLTSVSPVSAVYDQPGTYTITLYANKGTCLESARKVIEVDMPSRMVVPNVFTPNGDGANDLFILQQADNLTDITAEIFDRWGHKVYELTTSNGQIEWDGNNQYGKESPEGTYFYIIKATGKDGQAYDLKGTVSLIR